MRDDNIFIGVLTSSKYGERKFHLFTFDFVTFQHPKIFVMLFFFRCFNHVSI